MEPIRKRWPTRPLREIPRVTMLRRASFPGELDLVESVRLDECEFVPAPGSAEGSPTCGVAVAGEAAAGERLGLADA